MLKSGEHLLTMIRKSKSIPSRILSLSSLYRCDIPLLLHCSLYAQVLLLQVLIPQSSWKMLVCFHMIAKEGTTIWRVSKRVQCSNHSSNLFSWRKPWESVLGLVHLCQWHPLGSAKLPTHGGMPMQLAVSMVTIVSQPLTTPLASLVCIHVSVPHMICWHTLAFDLLLY